MLISHGVPLLGCVKQGRDGENEIFQRQYLESDRRCVQSYY